jgi:hypothetical protein
MVKVKYAAAKSVLAQSQTVLLPYAIWLVYELPILLDNLFQVIYKSTTVDYCSMLPMHWTPKFVRLQ